MNIDPGDSTADTFFLAAHKNFSHCIAVGEWVFAELAFRFSGRGLVQYHRTYPDFRSSDFDEALPTFRADFMSANRA